MVLDYMYVHVERSMICFSFIPHYGYNSTLTFDIVGFIVTFFKLSPRGLNNIIIIKLSSSIPQLKTSNQFAMKGTSMHPCICTCSTINYTIIIPLYIDQD